MNSPLMCLTEVEWREIDENPTPGSCWPHNQTCPQEGEMRWCRVHLYSDETFNFGLKRWLLFQTGNSLFNGFCESPEELDALALVEAEVLAVEEAAHDAPFFYGAVQWWQVRCVQVVPFASIPERLPPLPLVNLDDRTPQGPPDCASSRLALYKWGGQTTETQIYVRDASTGVTTHLVFYQISIGNQCEIYNWPVK